MFPGQGSQYVGMGEHLFDAFPELVSKANDVLGYSVEELCLRDSNGRLHQTEFTQPAVYVVSALDYLLFARSNVDDPGVDYFLGHSLGEYAALFAAGVFDFVSGLLLVKERARLMAGMREGGMAAIVGLDSVQVQNVLDSDNFSRLSVANYNSPSQTVISGDRKQISEAENAFIAAGAKRYVTLRVSGAFHSRFMEPAAREYERTVRGSYFSPPKVPVIANTSAREYKFDQIAVMLLRQLVEPVKWCDSVRYVAHLGVSEFQEIGPGRVLTGLNRQILR
jgi:[acyl-carrier-protein] S-malonyltransferase